MRWAAALVVAMAIAGVPVDAQGSSVDLQALVDAAEPGAVLVVPAGTHRGGIVIDKPLELRGEGWPVVDAGGVGTVITIDAPDVTIRGIVIANSGRSGDREDAGISATGARVTIEGNRFEAVLFGVYLRRAPDAMVVDNVVGALDVDVARRGDGIRVWESPDSTISGNTVSGGRDTVIWFSDRVVVRDNHISDGRYGIHFMYCDGALVERNRLEGNSVGGFLMYSNDIVVRDNLISGNHGPSGYGIGLKDVSGLTMTGNHLLANRVGVYFDNSPADRNAEHHITGNVFAYNEIGALFLPSVRGNAFTGNAFVDNRQQVGVQGSGTFEGNLWTVDGVGNHWSDFAGYDADADGIGDIPYRLADLFSTLTDTHPPLRFFEATPAAVAVDLAGTMFPAFRPREKVEDNAPIIAPPDIPVPVATPGVSAGADSPTVAVGVAMVGVAGGLWWASRKPLRRWAA